MRTAGLACQRGKEISFEGRTGGAVRPFSRRRAKIMSSYPMELRYTKEHEWVRVEDDICVLGITSFAQNQLGEVVFVEAPEVGQVFDTDDEIGTIESVKAVAEVYTPVAGEVVEVNEEVIENPELINDDPHGDGWLIKIRFSSSADLESLMDAEAYEAYTHQDHE
jgi:glycine cleavage system H protein